MGGFMAEIFQFTRDHSRASQTAGRGTSEGQSQSSGQRSENQDITSSYLRAVKVVAPTSTRSKKRQSPAARRPKVVKLSDFASAYAEAQAKRFDRNSVSMATDNSRKTPTAQEGQVGIFQLAESPEKSDKSAMPTVEHIRQRLERAMQAVGDRPVTLALELGLERNHIRDYLEGKKRSLKAEVLMTLSERYGIPLNELLIRKEKPVRKRA